MLEFKLLKSYFTLLISCAENSGTILVQLENISKNMSRELYYRILIDGT